MQCWINGPASGGIDDKLKMVNILLKTNVPAFHSSIIPFLGHIQRPQKTSIFSVGCRNSETFNYTRSVNCCNSTITVADNLMGKVVGKSRRDGIRRGY